MEKSVKGAQKAFGRSTVRMFRMRRFVETFQLSKSTEIFVDLASLPEYVLLGCRQQFRGASHFLHMCAHLSIGGG